MSYDLDAIREKVSMLELLAADGIAVQRKGARWFCACPFHAEKTASMVITERTGLFKCFGCGAGGKGSGIKGDVFGYWMATRGVEFHEAATALARMAGTGELPDGSRMPTRKIVERAAPVRPPALAGRDLENWLEGVEYLRESAGEHVRLAEWRGYSRDTIALLLERGAIGQPIYSGKRAWAFAVEAMNDDGTRYLCGWHVRVDPKGGEKKASWRFVPGSSKTQPSIGAWPMVLGDPATARALIFCEGEWDLAAAADVMAWGLSDTTKRVAIFGVRGGRNLAHTLGYQWPGEAQAFLFPDADETGGSWLEPDGLAALIKPRVRALHALVQGLERLPQKPGHRAEGAMGRIFPRAFHRRAETPQTQKTKGRNSIMIEQHQPLADGLYQIGKGPTSLWLYVKDGVLHVPTKGLNPIAWLGCVVTVVNGRTFIRASDAIGIAPHYREYVATFAQARGLKL